MLRRGARRGSPFLVPVGLGIKEPADAHAGRYKEKTGKNPGVDERKSQNARFHTVIEAETADNERKGDEQGEDIGGDS